MAFIPKRPGYLKAVAKWLGRGHTRPVRAGAFLGGLLAAAVISLGGPVGSASAADRDCADFPNRSAAQTYFDGKGGSPTNNVDRLDADHDGRACEELRCPCAVPGQNSGRLPAGGLYSFRVEDPLDSTHSEGRSDLREIAVTTRYPLTQRLGPLARAHVDGRPRLRPRFYAKAAGPL